MSQLNINTIKNKRGDYGPTLVGLTTVTGNLTVTGNITGDGSGLIGIPTSNIKSNTISNTGIITAAGFIGPLTGNVTGGVTGNVTGNVTGGVTGNLTGDVTGNLTGDVTGNISGTTGTFSGDVTVGGVLTYQDVTNVDSVGMITARKGIQVLADGINAVGVITSTNLVVENSIYTSISTTSTNKTLVNRELCTLMYSGVGTVANLTVTMPASPQSGWEVGVAIGGTFLDSIVARNGSKIMAFAQDMTVDKAYATLRFVYTDTYNGWRIF